MKNKLMLALSALIVLFSTYSCSNEFERGKDSGDVICRTYRSSFSDNTKTSINEDGTVDWTKDDIIRYYSSDGGEIGTFSIEEDSHSSVINVKMSKNDDYLVAVYGGQSIEDNTRNGFTLTGVAESVQDGSFQSAHVSVARTTDVTSEQLSFSTIVGIIQLSISNPAVKYVRFTANDGTQISGDGEVEVSFTQQGISTQFSSSESGDCIMLEVDGSGTYYFSTLPCSVSGFSIELLGEKEARLVDPITTEKVLNLSAGHIVNLGTIDIMDAINPSYVPIDWSNVTLTGYSDTTYTFSMTFDGGNVPDIKEGSILSVNAGTSGSIRIVTEVNISGNTATVTTIEGNLCDIFANTTLVLSTESQPSPVQTKGMDGGNVIYASPVAYIYEKNGRMYRQSLDMQTKGGALDAPLKWNINQVNLTDLKIPNFTLSPTKASFDINIGLMISMNFGSRNPIIAVKEAMTLYRSKALSVSSYLKGGFNTTQVFGFNIEGPAALDVSFPIMKNFLPPVILVFVAGDVPIFIKIGADLNLETCIETEGQLNITMGFTNEANATCGFNWSQNSGIEPISAFSNTFNWVPPTISYKGSIVGKTCLYPQFHLFVYSLLGPTFSIKPYLKGTFKRGFNTTIPETDEDYTPWSLGINTGIEASAGLEFDFLGLSIGCDTPDSNMVDKLLYQSPAEIVYNVKSGYKPTVGNLDTLTFTVKDYDGLKGHNVDTHWAQVVQFSGDGDISKKFEKCDNFGRVNVFWRPTSNSDVLKARLLSVDGSIIDSCEVSCLMPIAVTGEAHSVTGSSATVSCSFEQMHEGFKYGMKYWKDNHIDTLYYYCSLNREQFTEDFNLTNLSSDSEYHYCAFVEFDGQTTEGETKTFNTSSYPDNAIDLGLSVRWASCNIGATRPEDYGGYYAWGETEVKDEYNEVTYLFIEGGVDENGDGMYDYGEEYVDFASDISGTEYDVARVKLGDNWRMPTIKECHELFDSCLTEWTSVNGVSGLKATSRKTGNSIFLPAAGARKGTSVEDTDQGDYWSSFYHWNDFEYAQKWGFSICGTAAGTGWPRYIGFPVRPVYGE